MSDAAITAPCQRKGCILGINTAQPRRGELAERLRSGLQIPIHEFDTHTRLQYLDDFGKVLSTHLSTFWHCP